MAARSHRRRDHSVAAGSDGTRPSVTALCDCHGEPCYWQKNPKLFEGGHWECGVKRRAWSAARYAAKREAILRQRRDRYDADPLYRIGKSLIDRRRKSLKALQSKQEALSGALQIQGRD